MGFMTDDVPPDGPISDDAAGLGLGEHGTRVG